MKKEKKNETYLGDGLYASYDGFAVWLRIPREDGDHVCALVPGTLSNFIGYVLSIRSAGKVVRAIVREQPEFETIGRRSPDGE
jgi:hypothetical protein